MIETILKGIILYLVNFGMAPEYLHCTTLVTICHWRLTAFTKAHQSSIKQACQSTFIIRLFVPHIRINLRLYQVPLPSLSGLSGRNVATQSHSVLRRSNCSDVIASNDCSDQAETYRRACRLSPYSQTSRQRVLSLLTDF